MFNIIIYGDNWYVLYSMLIIYVILYNFLLLEDQDYLEKKIYDQQNI